MNAKGFTLLEVMVALAVGGIALGSIYGVGSATTRHFREQQRISATQTSLRSAMDQIKRDFTRAGFLSSPNVAVAGQVCVPPGGAVDDRTGNAGTGRLAAISAFAKNVARPGSLDPDDLNKTNPPWVTVDNIILMGNYVTSGEYSGIGISANGLIITIPMNWQSFQRDFTEWSGVAAGQCNTAAFNNAFPIGRLVRLRSLSQQSFFSRVSARSCANLGPVTVTLTEPVPVSCNMSAGWIAPVNTIRYQVEDSVADQTTRIGTNRVSILRRLEVMPDDKTKPLALPGNGKLIDDRSILDYVVSFNVNFLLRGGGPALTNVNFVPALETAVRANPEQARGVIIDLAARTAEHEPDFAPNALRPSLAFSVFKTRGAARVRRMHAELLLPNIANEGL